MVDTSTLRIHQLVRIGEQTGLVQGLLREVGKPDKVLVSFPNSPDPLTGKKNGVWNLAAYPPEEIDLR